MLCVALQGARWYLSGGWFHFRVLREAVMHDSTMRFAEVGSLAGCPQYWRKVITFNIWNVQKQIVSENVMGQGDWNRWTNHNSAEVKWKLAEGESCRLEMIYICKKLTCAPVTYSIVLAVTEALCGYQFILPLEMRRNFQCSSQNSFWLAVLNAWKQPTVFCMTVLTTWLPFLFGKDTQSNFEAHLSCLVDWNVMQEWQKHSCWG